MITESNISKGSAISRILGDKKRFLIAAGNDVNDISMFDMADVKIAMGDSREDVLEKADIIAPPAEEHGIISGLSQALEKYKNLY